MSDTLYCKPGQVFRPSKTAQKRTLWLVRREQKLRQRKDRQLAQRVAHMMLLRDGDALLRAGGP